MNIKIKFLFLILLLNSTFLSAEDNLISSRIVGGTDSADNAWPWMVYIQAGPYFCGGTLIDENTVLTAAHCVYGISVGTIFATVGEDDLTIDDAVKIGISKTYVHSDYNSTTYTNDIALLRLDSSVTTITPLARLDLTTTENAIAGSEGTTVIGWGSTVPYNADISVVADYPDFLYDALLNLQTNNNCSASLANYDSSTMLCASQINTDACQGDSGGPLVYDDAGTDKQIGIVSWGYGCADARYPGVYTRLAVYDDWINNFSIGITIDNELNFTETQVDETNTATLLVSNNSSSEAQVTFLLNGSSDFSINEQSCNTIAANTTCSVTISYSPNDESASETILTISSDLIASTDVKTTIAGTPYVTEDVSSESNSSSGGGSLLFVFSIPLLFLRRFIRR